ncbi:hypothetical protein EYF80_061584 [Liparis tanakae]|uniref:Uncharacterized protein n=1 Tax=Liparis tanakae TaxID=230148 RepID=A0A4Z2EHG9_9TELE|nr:hypothetical protein EYF80_061584 [Liparis tanakae]
MKLDQLDQEIENALSSSSAVGGTPTPHRRPLQTLPNVSSVPSGRYGHDHVYKQRVICPYRVMEDYTTHIQQQDCTTHMELHHSTTHIHLQQQDYTTHMDLHHYTTHMDLHHYTTHMDLLQPWE